jgi:hypothetical protein
MHLTLRSKGRCAIKLRSALELGRWQGKDMKKFKQTSILYVAFAMFPLSAFAGWFGPDNYEDCVLEKMKGQNKAMISTARKACEKQFPYEKELYGYHDNIEIGWFSDASRLYLRIENNYGEYTVTKYKANFSKKQCDETKTSSDYTLTKTFVFSTGKSASVSVENAGEYKCMQTETIWGRLRK